MSDVVLALSRRGRTPMIHQDEAAECGLACLAMIASRHGHEVDLLALRARFGVSIKGMTLTTLLRIAEQLKLDARPLRCDPTDFDDLTLPSILHWGFNHFVVLTRIKGRGDARRFVINDPANGERTVSAADMSAHFTGVVVEATPSLAFQRKRERSKLSLWQLWSRAPGLGGALGRVLLLSLLIEVFALAAPFYMQIGLDSVIPSHDLDFLTALAIGFGTIAILSQVTTFVRSWAIVGLSNELGYRLVSNLFRHMVRLPIGWFQKRSVGDVLTRFNASQPITELLGNGLVQAVVDGIMTIVTLALMLVYSPMLTGVTIIGLLLYILIRWSYFGVLRMRSVSVIQAQAREQAVLIETIRGITPIRLFGREQDRLRVWQARRASVVNASVGIARLQAVFSTANTTVIAIENILFVYIAIRLNLAGGFTIGMITAFGAYKQQFLSASLNVVGKLADYRMLDVQLGRIGDIALTPPEPAASLGNPVGPIESIELRDVYFAYGPGEHDVLAGVDLVIEPGETLAITGASGGGKTTLLKLLLGLLHPTEGKILVNGKVLTRAGMASYRERVGSVMQDDTLFAGSIAENIAFFDPQIDQERVEEAARLAIIHDDIMAMPMAYESLVGDMGSALSGGQKQRVLLARALYRKPQLLVMDEATAHLDAENEAKVNASLKTQGVACIIVAHRPSTIATADRQVAMKDGRISFIEPLKEGESRGITTVSSLPVLITHSL
ncbi:colicin V processing peptidase [Sphingomonas sp. PP-F2F-G114-C0414]|uniref:peptidase domain-containing ABC transporter n=1 Tax=Sphingomonas sp. PP-F2F-G114-C0414 TaxID=2135662 RepID=UPI000EF96988|nr:peptidase domain-containing ABC transporter [Sphingomonas sp. PP-F2F-G114-C0414]RMB25735.1 colicin V processing peptidase [Sphingomonas sp. PP-F2F-G114-C0414]